MTRFWKRGDKSLDDNNISTQDITYTLYPLEYIEPENDDS